MVKKDIAIIPARGGSKRIPRKNIMDFNGRPMISWTIEAALQSKCFAQVLVSTDDKKIAEIAVAAGASVPFFRIENADDDSSSSAATIGALKQAEFYWSTKFDSVVQLMPNCPLRDAKHIQDAMNNFQSKDISYQISGFEFGWMNPWWAVKLDAEMRPCDLFPEAKNVRSQDLEKLYCPTGAIWVAKRDALLEAGTFYGPEHRYFTIDQFGAIDIDDMKDYLMAIALERTRKETVA